MALKAITYIEPNTVGNTKFKVFYDPDSTVVDTNWTACQNSRQLSDGTPVLYPALYDVYQIGGSPQKWSIVRGEIHTGPLGALPVAGKEAVNAQTEIIFTNGSNDDVDIPAIDLVFVNIVGPTGAFTVTGIEGGYDGQKVMLYNSTVENMTIADNSSASAAGNRILTGSAAGGDYLLAGQGVVTLAYSALKAAWIFVSASA